MSELNERRWAVLSERGCEDSGLSYGEAAGLVARLKAGRVSGLCVVTGEAAAHVPRAKKAEPRPAPVVDPAPKRGRRKKTNA